MRELMIAKKTDPVRAKMLDRRPHLGAEDPDQPRYLNWFDGDAVQQFPRTFLPGAPLDLHEATRKLTCAVMEQIGTKTYGSVSVRMPQGSRLRRSIEARTPTASPLHGVCRVGRVILDRQDDEFTAAEFYVTNFDAKLDTSLRNFYTPIDGASGMFFGVGVVIDKTGRAKRFDLNHGKDGVYFQTKDLARAIYAIASISTGMSIEQLMEIDRNENNSVKGRHLGQPKHKHFTGSETRGPRR
ncbi:hypothetical protein ABUK73_20410 [Agrobacterium sp. BA1120]|uniref:hypothetical protein n=1 Tax=Agrobacterium sp. BA1120 TaxID=3228927 RepID=UPI003369E95D